MNYLQRNRTGNSKIWKTLIILLVLFFGLNFFLPNVFSGLSHKIAIPLWQFKEKTWDKLPIISFFQSKSRLQTENESLKLELLEIKTKLLDRNLLLEENQTLKEALGRGDFEDMILANVLVRPPVSAYDTFILDVGKGVGVEVGQRAYTFALVLIGEIVEVKNNSAVLKLLSSPGNKLQGYLDEAETEIEIVGRGAGNFLAEIPKDIEIIPGELVLLPGTNKIIGIVEEVISSEADSFQSVFVKSPINILEIKSLGIKKI